MRDDLVYEFVELFLNISDIFADTVVVKKLNVELAVSGDRQAANVLKLRAGGGEDDLLAVPFR